MTLVTGWTVYVAGITWFARTEATASRRSQLVAASAVMVAGLALIAALPWFGGPIWLARLRFAPAPLWPLLVLALALAPARRWWSAVCDPQPRRVQQGVKQSILFLIVLDAAVVLAFVDPILAMAILALQIPAIWLGRRIATT
jgi:hypothetical protein